MVVATEVRYVAVRYFRIRQYVLRVTVALYSTWPMTDGGTCQASCSAMAWALCKAVHSAMTWALCKVVHSATNVIRPTRNDAVRRRINSGTCDGQRQTKEASVL